MTLRYRGASLVAVVVLLTGCGGLQPEDPGLALKQGASAIAGLKTVTATLKVTKGTISFQGFALVSATAAIRRPTTRSWRFPLTMRFGDRSRGTS